MADALCGPSNPMQSLQKQTSADRTLQQDRLTSRPLPGQGFRSSGPNVGVLDPEFEAFQAGQTSLSGPAEHHAFHPAAFQASQQAQQNGQFREPGNWSGDFAKMNLSGRPSSLVHPAPARAQHLAQQWHDGSWQAEYARSQAQSSSQGQMQYDPRFQGQSMGTTSWVPQYNSGPSMMNFSNQQSQNNQAQARKEVFDDEAFARAFDEAESFLRPSADWELELDQAARDYERGKEQNEQDERIHQGFERADKAEAARNLLETQTKTDINEPTKRIGADLIINPITDVHYSQRPLRNPQEDNDAMARTAGHMLESVSDNIDPKFQNSQFLRLMQQLRDREVVVQGDKIVGIDEHLDGGMDKGKQVIPEVEVGSS